MGNLGKKWVRVSGKTDFQYKTDRIVGNENRNHFANMKEEQRKAYYIKTSEVIELINSMAGKGGDVLEKLEKFGEVCEWEYLTKKVLDEVARQINARDYVKAEKIFKEQFLKIRYCQIKGALSVGEIKAILNNKDKFMAFYRRFDVTVAVMKQEWKKIKAVGKIWRYYEQAQILLKSQSQKVPVSDYSHPSNPFAEAAREHREFMDAKKKMEALIGLCSEVLTLAPTGMKEYIQYNLDAFRAADAAMGIIDQYAQKIEEKLVEIDRLFADNDKNTTVKAGDIYKEDDKFASRANNYDYNAQLDINYGRPR